MGARSKEIIQQSLKLGAVVLIQHPARECEPA